MREIKYQWNGITKSGIYSKDYEDSVQMLFRKLKNSEWNSVFELASSDANLVNCVRPGSDSYYTILHGAARIGAPTEVINKFIDLGAFKTMKTKSGETPFDLARKFGHDEIVNLLIPKINFECDFNTLKSIENNLHLLITKETEGLVYKHSLRLPDISILLEIRHDDRVYFSIPGMMGGVSFSLKCIDKKVVLEVQIESRMWGGADYYEVSEVGSRLLRRES